MAGPATETYQDSRNQKEITEEKMMMMIKIILRSYNWKSSRYQKEISEEKIVIVNLDALDDKL